MLNVGIFQVYALEGTSNEVVEGKLSPGPNPKVLIDEDFEGLEAAAKKFEHFIANAKSQGFKEKTVLEELEFEAKLKEMREKKV